MSLVVTPCAMTPFATHVILPHIAKGVIANGVKSCMGHGVLMVGGRGGGETDEGPLPGWDSG